VIVTVWVDETALDVTVNVAELNPLRTFTVGGTVAAFVFELVS